MEKIYTTNQIYLNYLYLNYLWRHGFLYSRHLYTDYYFQSHSKHSLSGDISNLSTCYPNTYSEFITYTNSHSSSDFSSYKSNTSSDLRYSNSNTSSNVRTFNESNSKPNKPINSFYSSEIERKEIKKTIFIKGFPAIFKDMSLMKIRSHPHDVKSNSTPLHIGFLKGKPGIYMIENKKN